MVSTESVEEQLKRIHFNHNSWGRAEALELPNILLQDEDIEECVNGIYEGGFALLVATNIRMLLIDKKPLNFLTVEDLRFDMINEIDYSHRLFGATISVSAGSKNLKFRSYNQPRLRKLINHVQHGMAETKKKQSDHQQGQNEHLEQINQQLQAYLLATHEQQEKLREQLEGQIATQKANLDIKPPVLELPKPSPQLTDYLLAQRLIAQVKDKPAAPDKPGPDRQSAASQPGSKLVASESNVTRSNRSEMEDLYAEGMREIFGHQPGTTATALTATITPDPAPTPSYSLEINALRIAYSKLPMALRNRKFGRPSFHAHSQQASTPNLSTPAPATPNL